MSASNIRAGRAFVELFLDDSRVKSGLKGLQTTFRGLGVGVTTLGAGLFASGTAIAGSLLAAVNQATEMGSAMADMSARTGIGVEALSELGYAAQVSAVEAGALEAGLTKMHKAVAEAGEGGDKAAEKFTDLGLSLAEIQSLAPDNQFVAIADKISAIVDPAKRTAAAMSIFGKSGAGLLPLLNEGGPGLDALRQKARDLGLTMRGEDASAAEAFGDQMDTLWSVLKMGVFNIGSALIPELSQLVELVTTNAAVAGKWLRENRGLFSSIFKLAVGAVAVGGALIGLGSVMTALGFSGAAISTAFSAVGATLATIGSVLGLLLSPVVLVSAAVVGLGGYFAYQSGIIGEAVSFLSGVFGTLKSDTLVAFGAIKDALSAGDFSLAAKIIWATLRLEFGRGVAWLEGIWLDFTGFYKKLWTDATFAVAEVFIKSWATLQTAWNEVTSFMSDAWVVVTDFIVGTWNEAFAILQKAWVHLKSLFDDTVNVTAEIEKIDKTTGEKNQARQDEQNRRIGESDAARRDRNAEIEGNRKDALSALESDQLSKRSAIDAARVKREAELTAEIADLQAERDRLTKQAGEAAGNMNLVTDAGAGDDSKAPDIPKAKKAVESIGTFSGEAAGLGIGASSLNKLEDNSTKQVEQQKETNKILGRIAKKPGKFAIPVSKN